MTLVDRLSVTEVTKQHTRSLSDNRPTLYESRQTSATFEPRRKLSKNNGYAHGVPVVALSSRAAPHHEKYDRDNQSDNE